MECFHNFVDANQLGRRNLTEDQWQISIGRRYNREKKKQGGTGANQHTVKQSGKICNSAKTEEKLSDEYKVAPRTIHHYALKAAEFEHGAAPEGRGRDARPAEFFSAGV